MANSEKKLSSKDSKSEPRNSSQQNDVNARLTSSNPNAGEGSSTHRRPTTSPAANAARERWRSVVLPNTNNNSNPEPQVTDTEAGASSTNMPQESVVRSLSPLDELEALQRELDQIEQTEYSRARWQRLGDISARVRRIEALGQPGIMSTPSVGVGEVQTIERVAGRESSNVRIEEIESTASVSQPSQMPTDQAERNRKEGVGASHSSTGQNAAPSLPSTEEPSNCPICLEPFTTHAILQPCGHTFDFKCIEVWLARQPDFDPDSFSCPLCRRRNYTVMFHCPCHDRDQIISISNFALGTYCTGLRQRPSPTDPPSRIGITGGPRLCQRAGCDRCWRMGPHIQGTSIRWENDNPPPQPHNRWCRCQMCWELVQQGRLLHPAFGGRDYREFL